MTMQLPDEAIQYEFQAALTPIEDQWTPAAEVRARHFLPLERLKEFAQRLLQIRSQVAAERGMRQVPEEMQPLEPGFIDLPQILLDDFRRKGEASVVGRTLALANALREDADRVILLADGPHHLAARAMFQALCGPHHNERAPERRLNVPRIYFAGHDADNDTLHDLVDLLQDTCVDPTNRAERWAVVLIGKRGHALEPAIAHRVFRREATEYYGLRSEWLTRLFKAVTGQRSAWRDLFAAWGHSDDDLLTIPDDVGERYAAFTPAGLLPAALMGLDVRALLLGAAASTKRLIEEPFERNPVLQLAGVHHLLLKHGGKAVRVLNVWSEKLEGVGRWYAYLLAGGLGKKSGGPTPVATVQTRDAAGWNQLHLEGARDRVVLNLAVHRPAAHPIAVQMADHNQDDLNRLCRRDLPDLMKTAYQAMNMACLDLGRPASCLALPVLTEHTLGQLMQLLMLTTVVEARLMGINPYDQPSAESCEEIRHELLKQMSGAEVPELT